MKAIRILGDLESLGVGVVCRPDGGLRLVSMGPGPVPEQAVEIAREAKPDLLAYFARTGIRCPHCGGPNLTDDPVGIACTDCRDLAFVEVRGHLIRLDLMELCRAGHPVEQRLRKAAARIRSRDRAEARFADLTH